MGAAIAQILGRCVWERAPLVCLLLSPEGEIRQAGAFALTLAGGSIEGLAFHSLAAGFPGEDFSALVRRAAAGPVRLDFGPAGTGAFWFDFFPLDSGVLALGRPDAPAGEAPGTAAEARELARELAEKTELLARLCEKRSFFLGMAAHDLRNPLNAISMAVSILGAAASDILGEDRGLTTVIRESCIHMERLLNHYVDYSRIGSGQVEFRCVEGTRARSCAAAWAKRPLARPGRA